MSNLTTLATKLATTLGMGDGSDLLPTLKATAFKGPVSDAQMAALLVVANQYGLNPWTKEIYAFPDKNNGIVPVVGVDGWSRIINTHPQCDGVDFEEEPDHCTCVIYRKDRAHPTRVTEYLDECKRDTGPWKSHPRRMLRHKALIQCARLAFGYVGIYDQDEAERIAESIDAQTGEIRRAPERRAPEPYPADRFAANLPKWRDLVQSGVKSAQDIIDTVRSKATLTPEQEAAIRDLEVIDVEVNDAQEDIVEEVL
ncbi:MAG: phage recombination protein Bet [Thiomonas sp.]